MSSEFLPHMAIVELTSKKVLVVEEATSRDYYHIVAICVGPEEARDVADAFDLIVPGKVIVIRESDRRWHVVKRGASHYFPVCLCLTQWRATSVKEKIS